MESPQDYVRRIIEEKGLSQVEVTGGRNLETNR
jgi:hypothetical protein